MRSLVLRPRESYQGHEIVHAIVDVFDYVDLATVWPDATTKHPHRWPRAAYIGGHVCQV